MRNLPDSFNALRLMAAFSVLVSHQFALLGLPEPMLLGNSLGAYGIGVFFSLSGFMVSQSWQRDPHLPRFFARRALRLFPALAVVVLLTVFVLGPLMSSLSPAEYLSHNKTFKYLSNIALSAQYELPGVFSGIPYPNAVNGSLWSLLPEFKLYVCLALVGFLAVPSWTVAVYAIGAAVLAFLWNPPPTTDPLLFLSAYFFAGVALAKFPDLVSWKVLAFITPVASLALFMKDGQFAAWLVIPLAAFLAGRLKPHPLVTNALRGDWSYGVYLYAFPVQQSVIALGIREFWAAIFISSVVTLACAMVSWRLIEKPSLRLKPSRDPMLHTVHTAAAKRRTLAA